MFQTQRPHRVDRVAAMPGSTCWDAAASEATRGTEDPSDFTMPVWKLPLQARPANPQDQGSLRSPLFPKSRGQQRRGGDARAGQWVATGCPPRRSLSTEHSHAWEKWGFISLRFAAEICGHNAQARGWVHSGSHPSPGGGRLPDPTAGSGGAGQSQWVPAAPAQDGLCPALA